MQYIRDYYKVPAKRGVFVIFNGEKMKITGSRGPYLVLRHCKTNTKYTVHPTWEMEYLEK